MIEGLDKSYCWYSVTSFAAIFIVTNIIVIIIVTSTSMQPLTRVGMLSLTFPRLDYFGKSKNRYLLVWYKLVLYFTILYNKTHTLLILVIPHNFRNILLRWLSDIV